MKIIYWEVSGSKHWVSQLWVGIFKEELAYFFLKTAGASYADADYLRAIEEISVKVVATATSEWSNQGKI